MPSSLEMARDSSSRDMAFSRSPESLRWSRVRRSRNRSRPAQADSLLYGIRPGRLQSARQPGPGFPWSGTGVQAGGRPMIPSITSCLAAPEDKECSAAADWSPFCMATASPDQWAVGSFDSARSIQWCGQVCSSIRSPSCNRCSRPTCCPSNLPDRPHKTAYLRLRTRSL